MTGFTFRGRFTDSLQAAGVSFEVTQKAHNALRWLISRQVHKIGDQVFVAWAISGVPFPPPPSEDSWTLMKDFSELVFTEDEEEKIQQSVIDHGRDLG